LDGHGWVALLLEHCFAPIYEGTANLSGVSRSGVG